MKSFYVPRSNPDGYSVNVRCLDPATIEHVEVQLFDDNDRETSEAKVRDLSREATLTRPSKRPRSGPAAGRPAKRPQFLSWLLLRQEHPGLDHRIRVERHALDSLLQQPARELRMIGRTLAADADVFACARWQAEIAIASSIFTASSRSSKAFATMRRVAIQAERKLRHVVRADRHAVEVIQVLIGQQRVGRQLAHHDDLRPFTPLFRPFCASSSVTCFASLTVRTNGTITCTLVGPYPRAPASARGTPARSRA